MLQVLLADATVVKILTHTLTGYHYHIQRTRKLQTKQIAMWPRYRLPMEIDQKDLPSSTLNADIRYLLFHSKCLEHMPCKKYPVAETEKLL